MSTYLKFHHNQPGFEIAANMLRRIWNRRANRRLGSTLLGMEDYMLRDIGINRCDVMNAVHSGNGIARQ